MANLGSLTASVDELNKLDGVTASTAELNKLTGFTGAVADLNYAKDLNATGVTNTEFDYLDGVTSNIQTQFTVTDRSSLWSYGSGFSDNNHAIRAYSFNGFMFLSLNCVKASISSGDDVVSISNSNFHPDQRYSAPIVSHEGDLAFTLNIKTDGVIEVQLPVNPGSGNFHVVSNFWYRF
tara:strand:+ start:789 stop:1325 length:537 start_codon:yes stop_codon:yes gene_type:complete